MDDLEKPDTPILLWVIVGVLAFIGLFSILGFVFSTLFVLVRLAVSVGIIVLIVLGLRALIRR
ncbi:MAG: hypothetical protein JJU45_06725 [Acidimicrobiia bacterium]|nr:hypothetical protein [Acidimicrobiia bacterium]